MGKNEPFAYGDHHYLLDYLAVAVDVDLFV